MFINMTILNLYEKEKTWNFRSIINYWNKYSFCIWYELYFWQNRSNSSPISINKKGKLRNYKIGQQERIKQAIDNEFNIYDLNSDKNLDRDEYLNLEKLTINSSYFIKSFSKPALSMKSGKYSSYYNRNN